MVPFTGRLHRPPTPVFYYVHDDRLGTPQLVTDSTQTPQWGTTYDPYGNTGTIISGIAQNLRYPGQYFDLETGFNYNLNRDYMPNLGRYLETDPIGLGGGLNTYAYANGNPLGFTDPTGLVPSAACVSSYTAAGGAFGAICGATLTSETGPGLVAGALAGSREGSILGLGIGLAMCPNDSSKPPTPSISNGQSTPAPPDDNDPQKKGRPKDPQRQNEQVRSAARQADLDQNQSSELSREVEDASRKRGENLGYQDILRIAKEIKNGTY
jgi:RHS repeat-associated protein